MKTKKDVKYAPFISGRQSFYNNIYIWINTLFRKKWGIHYSMGGTGQIIKGFEKLMLEEKINILKESEVTKIKTKDKKITSIEINNNYSLETENVICNADPPGVYENLINTKQNFIFEWKQSRMDYSMGLFVYYFGTKKVYENVAHHTIKFGNKYKEHLDDIFEKKIK